MEDRVPDLDQFALAITIVLIGTAVHLAARPWKREALFFLPLRRLLTAEDRARSRRVVVVNALVSLGTLGALAAGLATDGWWWVALAAPWIPLLWFSAEFRGLVRTTWRLHDDRPGARRSPAVLVPLELVHGALVACSAAAFAWMLPRLPERVPVQWHGGEQVGRYGATELWAFLGVVLFNLLLTWLLVAAITRQRRIGVIVRAADYGQAQRQLRCFLAHVIEWMMFAVNVSFVAVWLSLAAANLPGHTWLLTLGTWGGVAFMAVAVLLPLVIYLPSLMRVTHTLREIMGAQFVRLSAD
jgi:hypothetical protein